MLTTRSSFTLVLMLISMSAAAKTSPSTSISQTPALDLPIAIPNSIFDECYPSPSNSSTRSDFGCGGGLDCIYSSPTYSQCQPTVALAVLLYQNCPVAMAGTSGSLQTGAPCSLGSFCSSKNAFSAVCAPCRTRFVTCGRSAVDPSIGCCPGTSSLYIYIYIYTAACNHSNTILVLNTFIETKCTAVNAIVAGQKTQMEICLPVPIATPTTLVKRAVKVAAAAATNYCYSGCSGAKVI